MTGKEKCNLLKTIRKELAEQNDINIQFDECTHSGDCKGTCPKCDAELKYIDDELKKRDNRGEPVIIPTGNEEIEQDNSKSHLSKSNLKELRPIKKIKEMIDKFLYEEVDGYMEFYPEGYTEPNKANNMDNRVKIGMDDRIHHTYEEIENV